MPPRQGRLMSLPLVKCLGIRSCEMSSEWMYAASSTAKGLMRWRERQGQVQETTESCLSSLWQKFITRPRPRHTESIVAWLGLTVMCSYEPSCESCILHNTGTNNMSEIREWYPLESSPEVFTSMARVSGWMRRRRRRLRPAARPDPHRVVVGPAGTILVCRCPRPGSGAALTGAPTGARHCLAVPRHARHRQAEDRGGAMCTSKAGG
jgi:hypothetical protein